MKKLASLLPGGIKLALFKRHLARRLKRDAPHLRLTLAHQPTLSHELLASLHKTSSHVAVGLDLEAVLARPFVYRMIYGRLPAVLRVLARTASEDLIATADLSDGGKGLPGVLTFCSNRDADILVPDPLFLGEDGYAEFRRPGLSRPWSERNGTVLWRGTSTGIGAVTTSTMDPNDTALRQRIRMCLILRSAAGVDAKLRRTETDASADDRAALARHGLLGDKINQADWGGYKFALDIDGHTNAWSNFYVRLLLGCCVLKIGSEHGFRQWYYNRLEPWTHYVPVRADMSDLLEKIAWCQQNDGRCAAIGEAARSFAMARTVETELADAARRLDNAATRPGPAANGV